MKKILIYGCYGYTGRLIAEAAAAAGMDVLLSGRDRYKVQHMGEDLDLPAEPVSLDEAGELDAVLGQCGVVIHCAGPFTRTYRAMAEACLRTGTHYLDITGEIEVFEGLAAMDVEAKAKEVMLLPGVGFDVIPTDCLGAMLKEKMPDAVHLDLAFKSVGASVSHGTATTMIQSLGESSFVRREGEIVPVALGKHSLEVDFGRGTEMVTGIPWGDVSTAYYTTGIPNVTTYTAIGKRARRFLGMANAFAPVLRSKWVRGMLQRRIDKAPVGPDAAARQKAFSLVWGRVRNAKGEQRQMRLRTQNGYTLTVSGALHCAQQVLDGNFEAGFKTPAGMYGSGLLAQIDPSLHLEDC